MKERPGASQTAPSGAFFSTGRGAAASPAHFCPPPSVYWGAKARLPPRCLFFCPRWGRGAPYCAPFHLPPCPLGQKGATTALLPTPLSTQGKGERCTYSFPPFPLPIGAPKRDRRSSIHSSGCAGKEETAVLSVPSGRSPCHWGAEHGCRPVICSFIRAGEEESGCVICPFPPAIPCLLEAEARLPPTVRPFVRTVGGGDCVTALPARHPLPNGMQNRACPVFATPPPFAGQATAPPPSPSF